ncbi:MAG: LCP family protein [Oscillospiraceae bacterium]
MDNNNNNNFHNRSNDYDESIDIFSDSSKAPKRSGKVPPSKPHMPAQQPPQRPSQKMMPKRSPQRPPQKAMQDIQSKSNNKNSMKKKQLKKKKKSTPGVIFAKVFFAIILVCLLIFAIGYGLVSNLFGDINFDNSTNKDNAYIDESKLIGDSGVKNILLIGGDAREGETSFRSDTMMLLSIDTNNKKLKMTSFLRDSWVEIPGRRSDKLNAACAFGGPQLVIDTIEYNFHVKIDNYALVDFGAFEDIVDALGGVTVSVTDKEARYMNKVYGGEGIRVTSGENVHLNGKEALKYCRIRKLDSDFYRTERQRKVMSAIKGKASSASTTTILKVVNKVLPYVKTDLKKNEMMSLSMKAATTYLKYDIVELTVPQDNAWRSERKRGMDVLVFDIDKAKDSIHTFIYEDLQ